jgi:maltose O-acetyltransferase
LVDWKLTAARGLGWLTTLSYRVGPRISIGPRLLGNGRLRISGPGRVVLEADVNAWSHAEVNRLVTTRPGAVIRIGRHARLNGCTIVAAERIGGQVSVMPGVRIGRDTVIGIHAVVFGNMPPGVIVGGNPARVLRQLDSDASGDNRDT